MTTKTFAVIVLIALTVAFCISPAAAQKPGTWVPTGSMNTARQIHWAVLLNNGKVLVTGGADATHSLDAAEIFDPDTGTWTPTASMNSPRNNLTATLLLDGRVLVAGGGNGVALATAEIYDPATGSWTLTGSLNKARYGHTAALITSGPLAGMVLVAGGLGSDLLPHAGAEVYDPGTGTWFTTGRMILPRYWDSPSPVTLPDGKIMVVGGTNCCPYHWFNEAEIFDPTTQAWTATPGKMTRANGRTVLLPTGNVLVAGGASGTQPTNVYVADTELFLPNNSSWRATRAMSVDRYDHTLTLLPSGQSLVVGGIDGGWGVCRDVSSAQLYDSTSGKWSSTGSTTVPRNNQTATLLPNGQVLVAGGADCEGHILSERRTLYSSRARRLIACHP